jgi:hypothetical protein
VLHCSDTVASVLQAHCKSTARVLQECRESMTKVFMCVCVCVCVCVRKPAQLVGDILLESVVKPDKREFVHNRVILL